ncbi:hypothetical protein ScPMuIL_012467 [Solemya velum]
MAAIPSVNTTMPVSAPSPLQHLGVHSPLHQSPGPKPNTVGDPTKTAEPLPIINPLSTENPISVSPNPAMMGLPPTPISLRSPAVSQPAASSPSTEGRVLDKRRLQELVKEVDPLEQLDEDVEEVLLQIADDFIESVVSSSCLVCKHRHSNTLEVKDVQLHLERNWNMWIPGFGSDEIKPYRKSASTEAHRQRMALIRKTMKKY